MLAVLHHMSRHPLRSLHSSSLHSSIVFPLLAWSVHSSHSMFACPILASLFCFHWRVSIPSLYSSLYSFSVALWEGMCRKGKSLVWFTPKCSPCWFRELGRCGCWCADRFEGCPLYFLQECPDSKWISERRGQAHSMINHIFPSHPRHIKEHFLPQQGRGRWECWV